MFNLITIGDSVVDNFIVIDEKEAQLQCDLKRQHCLLCLNYADKIPIGSTGQSVGGNAANLAVGCRKLGLNTSIVTDLGDDINGMIIKEQLEKHKVNTDLVKTVPNAETRFAVVLNYHSERTVLSHHVKRNYSLPKLPATEWIYYSSMGENFEKLQKNLIVYLKKNKDIKLAINPGSYQLKKKYDHFKQIIPFANLIFINKEEAKAMVGKKSTIKTTIKALHNLGIEQVVITDGNNGSHASNGKEIYFMPIYPIQPVGKTGAGDAFASGFLSALHYNKDISEAMQWGTANAGGVIQEVGAENGLLSKTQVSKLIKKYSKIKPKKI